MPQPAARLIDYKEWTVAYRLQVHAWAAYPRRMERWMERT